MKVDILHIVNRLEIGGVEVGVINLIKNMRNGYFVLSVNGIDSSIESKLSKEERAQIISCNGITDSIFKTKNIECNIVISSLWRSHLVSLLSTFKSKPIKIHFAHNARHSHKLDKLITLSSLMRADRVFCDSKQTENWILNQSKHAIGKSLIVPMNVSFSLEAKNFDNSLKFVYMGRFSKIKNIEASIDFVNILIQQGLSPTFDIYGRDDGHKQTLQTKIDGLGLSDYITIRGAVFPTEVEFVMRKSTFYLQTSSVEGMAISVFQALINGLIPVVTSVGEIPNYSSHKENAFFIDSNNIKKSAFEFIEEFKCNNFHNYKFDALSKSSYPKFSDAFDYAIDKVTR